jgi:hypothetical protein
MHSAVTLHCEIAKGCDLGCIGNIENKGSDCSAIGLQARNLFLEKRSFDIGHHNRHPFGNESFCSGETDTRRSTGNDCDFALEFHVSAPCCSPTSKLTALVVSIELTGPTLPKITEACHA